MMDYFKEYKGCANCKHQPEPLCTCEWLKNQTYFVMQCPKWEKEDNDKINELNLEVQEYRKKVE